MICRYRGAARLLAPLVAGLAIASPAVPAQAAEPPPGGTIAITEASGTDSTILHGVTGGPCDAPGRPGQPVDGYNVVVSGPGGFTPDPSHGRPEGQIVTQTTDAGLSTTAPIPFTFRAGFRDVADELGAPLSPGTYTVTFRCVNQLDGVIYQRYSTTLTFTGGPPATDYTLGAVAAPPHGPDWLLIGGGAASALAAVAVIAVLLRTRRAPRR